MILRNCRILKSDGEIPAGSLHMVDGYIEGGGDLAPTGQGRLDGQNLLLLPGIVDLHGDGFERHIMPRAGARFPLDLALEETDRQLAANGITTAFYGLSYTWEPGLRCRDGAVRFFKAFETMRSGLRVSSKLHLRYEISHVEGAGDVLTWLEEGKVDLLAFNDHIPYMRSRLKDPLKRMVYAERTGLSTQDFKDLFEQVCSRQEEYMDVVIRLAEAARGKDIPMASHDEEDPEIREWYHGLGCRLCEFPCNRVTAQKARELGDPVILGGPNVLQGSSLYERLSARESVAEGLCSILASDYYYPSQLQAAFCLSDLGLATLKNAWDLVSIHPAKAAGLHDRGELVPGKRADCILVDDSNPKRPKVEATIIEGKPVFVSHGLLRSWSPQIQRAA